MLRLLFGLICVLCSLPVVADDLAVLEGQTGDVPPREMMPHYFMGLTREALDRRAEAYERVKTVEDCIAYQKRLREFFVKQLGGWPERTPLNAQVVAQEMRNGYRIERIIYESLPKFYVTALFFLPVNDPPYPAVLVPCGHSSNGKASEAYQRACIFLAKSGIAALIYDPIGQGERFQILDENGQGAIGGTLEHTLTGVAAILVGMNTATFRIWDGMRGIDYLLEREDIDPDRIGCTGNSGGGTLTSYIMALDPRVKVAAPSCYLTSFERLLETDGPQDAEQDIYAQVAFGMDHADYVIMRAPKPTLMCCATQDFFDINGSWDSFRQAKRFYTRMGFSERVDIAENDAKHGFSQPLRTAMVRWMRRWLLGSDDPVVEPDFPILTDEEALCTPGGQVLQREGARSVWDIMADREVQLAKQRKALWAEKTGTVPGTIPSERDGTVPILSGALARVREIAGIRPLAHLPEPEVAEAGTIQCNGYRIEKLVLKPELGIFLPALAFIPEKMGTVPSGRSRRRANAARATAREMGVSPLSHAYLYLHGQGKHVDADPGGPIERLVNDGHLVLAVDLRGIGETESALNTKGWRVYCGPDWQDYFRAYLLGKSYVGLRAEDTLVCTRFLAGRYNANAVHLIAIGEAAVPALHAAALEPDLFASVQLDRMVTSWADVVRTPKTRNQLINTIHNALATYDLPDLVNTLPADKVKVLNPLKPDGKPAQTDG